MNGERSTTITSLPSRPVPPLCLNASVLSAYLPHQFAAVVLHLLLERVAGLDRALARLEVILVGDHLQLHLPQLQPTLLRDVPEVRRQTSGPHVTDITHQTSMWSDVRHQGLHPSYVRDIIHHTPDVPEVGHHTPDVSHQISYIRRHMSRTSCV